MERGDLNVDTFLLKAEARSLLWSLEPPFFFFFFNVGAKHQYNVCPGSLTGAQVAGHCLQVYQYPHAATKLRKVTPGDLVPVYSRCIYSI